MLTHTGFLTHSKRVHRVAVGSMFFLQGICFASWGSRIPTLQQSLGLSETALGMALFALPVGLMLSLPFSGWLIAKIGSRKVVIGALLLYALLLPLIGFVQQLYQFYVVLFFFGFAANMVNISVNTQAVGVEALYSKSIMATFHGFWSMAGFIGAAIGTAMIGLDVLPYQHFSLISFITLVGVAAASGYILREDVKTGENQPVFAMPDKSLLNLGIIAFCAMLCEGAMFDWSGVYFKKVVLAQGALIGAGYTSFMLTMAFGRFVADSLTSRFGLRRILQGSGVLITLGLGISITFPSLYAAIFGFFLVGAGVSAVIPLVYSAAGKSKVMSPGVALAAVSSISFLGFLIGPPMIGLIAGATSLRASFAVVAVIGLCVTFVATRSRSL